MNREQLESAISAQESLRGAVADDVVDAAVAALRMQLTAIDSEARRRRQATIVFADVSGFTTMAEFLDAEDVTDVMNEVWERLDAIVTSHGGRIDKHIGDALMAIWGAHTVREDDAEQAVRAALGMQDAMRDLRADTDTELRVRIGVNTGPVVLGSVGSQAEFTAMGDAVNVASRLEHAAPIDGVLISHDTYRNVKGVFTVRAQPPLEVKGKEGPLRTYVIEAVRPRAFRLGTRGVEGVETRMIGRDTEIGRLRTLLADTLADGRLRSATVVGDAGVGKSRLLYEFEDWLRLQPAEVRLLKARADRQHVGVPHFVIRDLLFSRFAIAEDDPSDSALHKLRQGMRELAPPTTDRDVELVAAMVGVTSVDDLSALHQSPVVADQMRAALATFMSRVASELPAVVLLEDLHWADRSSLEAIEALMSRCGRSPVLVLTFARPTLFDRHDPAIGWDSLRLELTPLGDADTRRLVEEVLQKTQHVPNSVLDEISTTAAGNPFFVEELVKVMIDDRTVVVDDDEWTVHDERLARIRPPSTITGVLQARVDRLPSVERGVLECASVIGRTFWDDALRSVAAGQESSPDLTSALSALESKELVFRQSTSGFVGTNQYIFKHALLQEVVYDLVLKRDRERLHRHTAEWLRRRDDSDQLSAPLALHYRAAGDLHNAALWSARAGRDAARRWALRDALPHLAAARETDVLAPEVRLQVLDDLSTVLTPLARHLDGVEVGDEMIEVATGMNDFDGQVIGLLARSFHLVRLGRLEQGLEACEQAEALSRSESTDLRLRGRVSIELGWILLRLGRTQQAIEGGLQALSMLAEQGEPELPDSRSRWARDLRGARSLLGAAQHAAGNLDAAEQQLLEALRLDREQGHAQGEAGDLINLGVVASSRGDATLAVSRYEEAMSITREIEDVDQEALALNNMGLERINLGDYEMATTHLTKAIELFVAADALEHTPEAHHLLARAQLGLGDLARAETEARRALAIADETGNADHLGNAYLTLGAVAESSARSSTPGDTQSDRRDDWIEQGLTVLRTAGLEAGLVLSLRQLAHVADDIGNARLARRLRRLAQEGRPRE